MWQNETQIHNITYNIEDNIGRVPKHWYRQEIEPNYPWLLHPQNVFEIEKK